MQGPGKRDVPEKTRRPAVPTCENPGTAVRIRSKAWFVYAVLRYGIQDRWKAAGTYDIRVMLMPLAGSWACPPALEWNLVRHTRSLEGCGDVRHPGYVNAACRILGVPALEWNLVRHTRSLEGCGDVRRPVSYGIQDRWKAAGTYDIRVMLMPLAGYWACPPALEWNLVRHTRSLEGCGDVRHPGYVNAACRILGPPALEWNLVLHGKSSVREVEVFHADSATSIYSLFAVSSRHFLVTPLENPTMNDLEVSAENARYQKQQWQETIKFHWQSFRDPDLRRQFKKYAVLGTAALSEEKHDKLEKIVSEMESIYSKAKICDYKNSSNCELSLEPALEELVHCNVSAAELKELLQCSAEGVAAVSNVSVAELKELPQCMIAEGVAAVSNVSVAELKELPHVECVAAELLEFISCVCVFAELVEILRTSRDPAELQHVWLEWRRVSGERCRSSYEHYVALNNEAANLNTRSSSGMKELGKREIPRRLADQWHRPARFPHARLRNDPAGDWARTALVGSEQANRSATAAPFKFNFTDTAEYWLTDYEATDFPAQVEKLWKQMEPLYKELHAYVRRKLREKYGDDVVSARGPIPAHLLDAGNEPLVYHAAKGPQLDGMSADLSDMDKLNYRRNDIFCGYSGEAGFAKTRHCSCPKPEVIGNAEIFRISEDHECKLPSQTLETRLTARTRLLSRSVAGDADTGGRCADPSRCDPDVIACSLSLPINEELRWNARDETAVPGKTSWLTTTPYSFLTREIPLCSCRESNPNNLGEEVS
ncbi:hypothetical protein PR048_007749 [Dryococelus australis]|uniref:Angiotensin-converting enzyme n=1 Tax=Dryococelus australis TaxID=614101 RepID=A0ABQ9HVI8_9NEOP|nr:hypothetical protein PR048_007749 [Dryococelus australis]